jgi:hypothetical protein
LSLVSAVRTAAARAVAHLGEEFHRLVERLVAPVSERRDQRRDRAVADFEETFARRHTRARHGKLEQRDESGDVGVRVALRHRDGARPRRGVRELRQAIRRAASSGDTLRDPVRHARRHVDRLHRRRDVAERHGAPLETAPRELRVAVLDGVVELEEQLALDRAGVHVDRDALLARLAGRDLRGDGEVEARRVGVGVLEDGARPRDLLPSCRGSRRATRGSAAAPRWGSCGRRPCW